MYTHNFTVMFMLLGLLTTVILIAVTWNFGILNKGQFGLALGIIAGAVYLILVWGCGTKNWFARKANHEELAKAWHSILGHPLT
jgi:hypothetical protein